MAAGEEDLLAACRLGERDALSRLVDGQYDGVHRFLWRLTGSPEEASELTQETFLRALARIDGFDGRSTITTWLCAIALNLWRTSRRRRSPVVDPIDAEAIEPDPVICEAEALARLKHEEVRRAVGLLPDGPRAAIILFYYHGMSYAQIATICGRPVGTVGSWIHHGLRRLRRLLDEPESAPEPRPPPRCRPCRENYP